MPLPTRAHVTIVRNPTNVTRYYSFLGPRGMTLEPNQTAAIEGDIFSGTVRMSGADVNALTSALINNHLEILQTPYTITYGSAPIGSPAPFKVYVFTAADDAPTVSNPDYGAYFGPAIPSTL